MSPSDPQFLYFVLVLPALFGITMFGDGINKLIHKNNHGYVTLIFGVLFFVLVLLGYLFFSTYLIGTN